MRLRTLALCACTLLLTLPDGFNRSPFGAQSAAGHGRCQADKHRRDKEHGHRGKGRGKKQDPPPMFEERTVDLFIIGRGFGSFDEMGTATSVFGDVYDAEGNLVGTYEELWEPVYNNGSLVGLNGVAMFTFNGADPTLSGTLTTANATTFSATDFDDFLEPVLNTLGEITNSTGDLAGTTGNLAMLTTSAVRYGVFIYFDSQVRLTLKTQTGG